MGHDHDHGTHEFHTVRAGMLCCTFPCPGHLHQVQSKCGQQQPFSSLHTLRSWREGDGCPDFAVRWERGMAETYLWTQEHGKGLWCHTLDIALVALGTFSKVFSVELGLFENWTILKIGLPDAFVNCSQGEFILKSKSTVNYNEVEIVLKRLGMSFWRRPLNFK